MEKELTLDRALLLEAVLRLPVWFAGHKSEMPWRRDPSPYRVWISEVMLQQTRTAAVVPYFERFLAELPTPAALAGVSDERLMKLWEGLGYYSRARNLKRAAAAICEVYGGELPDSFPALLSLPGIGEYTAGAIASIAFGRPEPAVDGNVLRVLMRLFDCGADVLDPKTKKAVTLALRSVYPSGKGAAALTESLMELGEKVCIPGGVPRCLECPLAEICLGLSRGTMTALPKKAPKKSRRIENRSVLLLSFGGEKFALYKRPERGLLASLWEFPGFEGFFDADELREKILALGFRPLTVTETESSVHVFTHIEWHMRNFLIECEEGAIPEGYTLASRTELMGKYALPRAFATQLKTLGVEFERPI